MLIGIVGSEGIVGNAVKFGLQKLGHEVLCHDITLKTKIQDLAKAEIVFICVPTPAKSDGSCDISIVESVVEELILKRPVEFFKEQIIAVKSTVIPGTLDKLIERYPYRFNQKFKFAFVPEFLRERCAITDYTENHDLLLIGTYDDEVFEKIKKSHGKFPKNVVKVNPKEAEFAKYFNNAFGAMRVVFANSFYEICQSQGVDYTQIKNAIVNIRHIPDFYLDVNTTSMRGYAGVCYEKDIPALAKLEEETKSEFFRNLIKENNKYLKTVFPGTREK